MALNFFAPRTGPSGTLAPATYISVNVTLPAVIGGDTSVLNLESLFPYDKYQLWSGYAVLFNRGVSEQGVILSLQRRDNGVDPVFWQLVGYTPDGSDFPLSTVRLDMFPLGRELPA